MPDIKFTIEIDTASGTVNIQNLGKAIEGSGQVAAEAHGPFDKLWQQVALGDIVSRGAQKGLSLFWGELKSVVKFAAEAEQANSALDSALFSTGRESANLSKHFKDQADALMNVSRWDDEVIKGAQTMLLQLTKLDAEGIDRATKGAMGLAKVFTMDLGSASELVAKWMSGNTDRLSKYGIHVKDTMTEEEKRNEIMKQLLVYYQRVLSDTETYTTRISLLKNSYGELKEEMGRYFTENVKLDKILGVVVQGLRDFFNAGKDWRAEQEKGEKANVEWGNRIYEAAKKAGMSNEEIRKMIFQFRELTPETEELIKVNKLHSTTMDEADKKYKINADNMAWAITLGKYGKEVKEAYLKVEKEYNAALDAQAKKQKAAEKGTQEFTEAIKFSAKAVASAGLAGKAFEIYTIPQLVETESKGRHMGMVMDQAASDMQMDAARVGFSWKTVAAEIARQWQQKMAEIGQYTDVVLRGMDDVFNQFFENKSTRLENDYIRQREFIEKSKMSEEDKNKAFERLDAEFAEKKRAAKRKEFIAHKAVEAAETLMSGARAFVEVLPDFILAAIIGVLTAAKVGLILAQPVPLATGGVFTKATRFMTEGGGYYEAERGEMMIPPGKAGGITHIHIPISIGGEKIQEFVIKVVQQGFNRKLLAIPSKVIA
jgi:hypothetical protein